MLHAGSILPDTFKQVQKQPLLTCRRTPHYVRNNQEPEPVPDAVSYDVRSKGSSAGHGSSQCGQAFLTSMSFIFKYCLK